MNSIKNKDKKIIETVEKYSKKNKHIGKERKN